MLTSSQIKKLPKGDYPNHMLVKMFPKQQGHGKSAKLQSVKVKGREGKKDSFVQKLINQFTGKPVRERKQKKG